MLSRRVPGPSGCFLQHRHRWLNLKKNFPTSQSKRRTSTNPPSPAPYIAHLSGRSEKSSLTRSKTSRDIVGGLPAKGPCGFSSAALTALPSSDMLRHPNEEKPSCGRFLL